MSFTATPFLFLGGEYVYGGSVRSRVPQPVREGAGNQMAGWFNGI